MIDRLQLAGFIDALQSADAKPSTARSRQLGVRWYASWLLEEDEPHS